MRAFDQSTLDAHLASLAKNLTPEQAQQVKNRVRDKISSSNFDLSPDVLDGAFQIIGGLINNRISLSGLGGAGEKLSGIVSALNIRGRVPGSIPGGDLAGQAGDTVSGVLGGIGRLVGGNLSQSVLGKAGGLVGKANDAVGSAGNMVDVLSKLVGSAGSAGGSAAGVVGDLASNASGVVGAAGSAVDLAGIVLEALGDVLGAVDV